MLMQSRFSRWVCGLVLTVAAASAVAAPPPDAVYTVKPGDILKVSVWKEPELQSPVLVQPDGTFTFPLCGEIDARDKSVEQLQQMIGQRLARFIINPRVDVMQALSMAGGTTPFASLGNIKILRHTDNGGQVAMPFNYNDVIHGSDLSQNITLQAGDVVVVP